MVCFRAQNHSQISTRPARLSFQTKYSAAELHQQHSILYSHFQGGRHPFMSRIFLLQKQPHLYDDTLFEIFPPVAKYIGSTSPIHSPTPAIPADKVQDTQASLLSHEEGASSSYVPPCYLEAGHSVSLSLPIRSKMPSRKPPFNFPTATYTNKKK